MAHFENVTEVIFVPVKPRIKPLARLGPTPPTKDPLPALNAHLAPMPTLLAPQRAKCVILIPTKRNPMLRHAFQCKQGITNRVQQPKLNARRVKQELVAMLRVKIVTLDHIKTYPATPRAVNAPLDGRLKTAVPNAPPAARARLDKAVKIAQWGLHEKQTTMRLNANDANQV